MIAVFALGGIVVPGTLCLFGLRNGPGSRPYKPASVREEQAIAASTRDVYPDDVRANLSAHQVQVAWAGLLQRAEVEGTHPNAVVTVTVEHHYFDWIEDHGVQREIHLLSPRGEGTFRCSSAIDPRIDLSLFRRGVVRGLMIVAYGTPTRLDGPVVDLGRCAYLRIVPGQTHSTTRLNYGRTQPVGSRRDH